MKLSEVRNTFIKYFAEHGHSIVPSSSLIPRKDPTLLFTNAGMNQFKDVFLGLDKRNYTRATSSQKCVRAGGKHNDLDRVGYTYRHHTFFEMLGNFSFGDYFKVEAIQFAWELLTKIYKIPEDRLYVTVYKDDDEAYDIWNKKMHIPANKIFRFGEKDNFWSMGDTGPCGPCSEIFYDHGKEHGCDKIDCTVGCDCDRFVEIWNLVFMQYNRDESGKITALPKPSIDTGAGLERLTAVMQGVASNYSIDLFKNIKDEIAKGAKFNYSDKQYESAYNAIADHLRATAFLISDGCLPSNEGAGYVLRRIIRRAIRLGKQIGYESPFMYQKISKVIELMGDPYIELVRTKDEIIKVLKVEEERFYETLERGLGLLDKEILLLSKGGTLKGDIAFKLYDTYGFPLDLTTIICAEKDIKVDEQGFNTEMEKQRTMARSSSLKSGENAFAVDNLAQVISSIEGLKKSDFKGYETDTVKAKCIGISDVNLNKTSVLITGQKGAVVFDNTPFYAKSGGQISDTGVIKIGNKIVANVVDVDKKENINIHFIDVIDGSIESGKEYTLEIDSFKRRLIERNHTTTHILHYLLRKYVGPHVKQAGSFVGDNMLTFDFSHYERVSPEILAKIEDECNRIIVSMDSVSTKQMSYNDAVSEGAMALFDEKYGDVVRVVHVGNFSTELCGGTHAKNVNEIGLVKILSESSTGAGVRRLEAVSSYHAYRTLNSYFNTVNEICNDIKATREELPVKFNDLIQENKNVRKETDKLKLEIFKTKADDLINTAKEIKGAKLIIKNFPETSPNDLREMGELLKSRNSNTVIVFLSVNADVPSYVAFVAKELIAKIKAGDIIKFIASDIGGKGGGKPDFAQGGGGDTQRMESMLVKLESYITAIAGN